LIIAFCGHSEIPHREPLFDAVIAAITERAEGDVTFYLGGYGDFDAVALLACKKYRETHPTSKLIFVTPYPSTEYLKNRESYLRDFDGTIYPEIESTLPRYAISKRNEWIAENADFLIAYVNYGWGGAAKMLRYAIRKKKNCLNLGNYRFE